MKKVLVMLMLVLGCTLSAHAQFAIKAGAGVSNIDDNAGSDAILSWKVGAGYEFRLNNLIGIETSALLTSKGCKYKSGYDIKFRPLYLEIPVMVNFHVVDNLVLGAGVYMAPVLSKDKFDSMNSVESGLRGGVRYGFNNGLEIGLDMDYGVSKVFDEDEDSHQASAAIVLGYRF